MSVGVMKDYKLKRRNLRASHTLGLICAKWIKFMEVTNVTSQRKGSEIPSNETKIRHTSTEKFFLCFVWSPNIVFFNIFFGTCSHTRLILNFILATCPDTTAETLHLYLFLDTRRIFLLLPRLTRSILRITTSAGKNGVRHFERNL